MKRADVSKAISAKHILKHNAQSSSLKSDLSKLISANHIAKHETLASMRPHVINQYDVSNKARDLRTNRATLC